MTEFHKVLVTRVVDGDTFHGNLIIPVPTLQMDMNLKDQVFRLTVVDTPERGEENYFEATEFTAQHIEEKEVTVVLHGKDNWSRWLVDVYIDGDLNNTLNDSLLKEGLAKKYKKGE
jgi:endonuclease YncB( thermonuclease family)